MIEVEYVTSGGPPTVSSPWGHAPEPVPHRGFCLEAWVARDGTVRLHLALGSGRTAADAVDLILTALEDQAANDPEGFTGTAAVLRVAGSEEVDESGYGVLQAPASAHRPARKLVAEILEELRHFP